MHSDGTAASSGPRQPPGAANDPAFKRPLIPALVWIGLLLLTLILTGCRSFSAFYAAYLAGTLAVAAVGLLMLNALYRRGDLRLFASFKKFTGYSIVAHYILHSLPRVGWSNDGLIGESVEIYLYCMTLACAAAGIALFVIMSRKPVLVAFGVLTREEAADPALLKQNRRTRKRGILFSMLEWVDVIAYAIIVVLLVNIFIFQLNVVPSESMVPVFLEGDRPFTLQLTAAPRLPLTPWRLPFLKQPARGDVALITNPRYPENSGVNLKKYLAQAIYKVTFTLVNIDQTTEAGEEKADPLVKRIVGMPGEKLMMVDDVLYARTAEDPEFKPVEQDRRYAQTDLWRLAGTMRIRDIPIRAVDRELLSKWDAVKNSADPAVLAEGLVNGWQALERHLRSMPADSIDIFQRLELLKADSEYAAERDRLVKASPGGAKNPLCASGIETNDLSLALALIRSSSTRAAVKEFVISAAEAFPDPAAYRRSAHVLNLLVKLNVMARVDRDIELISEKAGIEGIWTDPERIALLKEAEELSAYLTPFYYDSRNFAEFPPGDAFLGPEEYFAMGDNRYNSLDCRMWDNIPEERALDEADPTSVRYMSYIEPFAVEKRFIDGYAVLRVWPFSRFGLIR